MSPDSRWLVLTAADPTFPPFLISLAGSGLETVTPALSVLAARPGLAGYNRGPHPGKSSVGSGAGDERHGDIT